jgi:hypothetical protein
MTKIPFLNNHQLEQSNAVANSTMNRDRRCVGSNSYTKELGFNPIGFLESRQASYVGADDQAGANYTGQPVVDSHYRRLTESGISYGQTSMDV